jgi:hypothetical protein
LGEGKEPQASRQPAVLDRRGWRFLLGPARERAVNILQSFASGSFGASSFPSCGHPGKREMKETLISQGFSWSGHADSNRGPAVPKPAMLKF